VDVSSAQASRIIDDQVVRMIRATLLQRAQRLVGTADAEDVVQEAFERAFRARTMSADRDLRPWLYRIARNVAYDALRTRIRPTANNLTSPDVESAEISALRLETAAEIDNALRRLPDTQRRIVQLRYFEGYSNSEIASIEGVPYNTVRTRLHRARIAMRDALSWYAAPRRPVEVR
jgi:RNA polymerase sigma-70 factor (ECF subfamily)